MGYDDLERKGSIFKIYDDVLGETGVIDGKQAMKIINNYVLAFFNFYLNGKKSALLEGPSPFNEVEFSRKLTCCASREMGES